MKLSRPLIPKYARLPLLAALIINCLTYWATRLLTRGAVHYDLTLALDDCIPFVPAFIVIYILAYVQWVVGYIVISRESPERCYRVMSGEILSKLVCFVFFLALPTVMVRPEVTGRDLFSRLTALIYALDAPDNLFPSIHCAESWICFRGTLGSKSIPRWYKVSMLLLTLLVFASVVLVKQHVAADILGGLMVAELGQLLAARLGLGRIFQKLNARRLGDTL